MNSLLRKLKVLINASVRGSPRHERDPEADLGKVEEGHPRPEVIEASPDQRELPEVTEAPQTKRARANAAPSARRAEDRVEPPKVSEDRVEELEEGRVADLLKGHESS